MTISLPGRTAFGQAAFRAPTWPFHARQTLTTCLQSTRCSIDQQCSVCAFAMPVYSEWVPPVVLLYLCAVHGSTRKLECAGPTGVGSV